MEKIVSLSKNKESKILKQFSRFAQSYGRYNVIQTEVAKLLVERIPTKFYPTIIDLGSGDGEVYKNLIKKHITFEKFVAWDSSEQMLALHPKGLIIDKYMADFNYQKSYENIKNQKENTLLISSSALQWSEDLDFVFRELSQKASRAYFAIFTSNTFKTLHEIAQIDSPIYTAKELQEVIEKYYRADFELKKYTLVFKTVREMFQYIKKSGVSGGEKRLSYKQSKKVMQTYPLDYLEFEVLFVEATSLA